VEDGPEKPSRKGGFPWLFHREIPDFFFCPIYFEEPWMVKLCGITGITHALAMPAVI